MVIPTQWIYQNGVAQRDPFIRSGEKSRNKTEEIQERTGKINQVNSPIKGPSSQITKQTKHNRKKDRTPTFTDQAKASGSQRESTPVKEQKHRIREPRKMRGQDS